MNFDQTLNTEGIQFICERYAETFNISDVTYEYDKEKKVYLFKSGENIIGECNANESLGNAIHELDSQFIQAVNASQNSIGDALTARPNELGYTSVGNVQRGVNRKQTKKSTPKVGVNKINLSINKDEFDSVIAKIKDIKSSAIDASEITNIDSDLTKELKSWHDKQSDSIKKHDVKDIKELLDEYIKKIKTSVDIIESTDDNLKSLLTPTIDHIFSLSNKLTGYGEKTVEEKKEYLNNLKNQVEETLSILETEFKEKCYDLGVPFTEEFCEIVMPFVTALGINSDVNQLINIESYLQNNGLLCLSPGGVAKLCQEIDENHLFENIQNYINGGKFSDTLLETYRRNRKQDSEVSDSDCEQRFLREYLRDSFGSSYGILDDEDRKFYKYFQDTGINPRDFDYAKNFSEKEISSIKSLMNYMCTDENGKLIDFRGTVETSYNNFVTALNDLSSTQNYVKELDKEIKLLDYNVDMNSETYWKYLAQDHSKHISEVQNSLNSEFKDLIPYLSQEEFSLVYMYLNEKNKDKSLSYLKVLRDDLNKRKGFDEACKTLIENNGIGVGEAFVDGIVSWFDSVKNVLHNVTGEMLPTSVAQYKNMFITTMLETAVEKPIGERGIYEDVLKNISQSGGGINKASYTLANQTGNMIVPVIVGSLVGSPLVGSALVGVGAAGSAMGNAVSRGETDRLKVLSYGFFNGLSEAALTYMLSSIPGIGEAFQEGTTYVSKCLGECKEEFLQTFIENGLNSLYFGDEFNLVDTTSDAMVAGLYGFLLSGIFNGASMTINWAGKKISTSSEAASNAFVESNGNPDVFMAKLMEAPGVEISNEFDYTENVKAFMEAQGVEGKKGAAQIDRAYYDAANGRLRILMKDGSVKVYSDIHLEVNTASAADSSSSSASSSDVDTMSSESIKSRGLNSETLEVSNAEYEVLKKNGDIVSERKTGGKGTTIVEIIDENGVIRKRQLVIIDEKTAQERANNSVVNNTTNSTATNDTSDASKNSAQEKPTSQVTQEQKTNELNAQHQGEIEAENQARTNDTSDASKNSAQEKPTSQVTQEQKANELEAQHQGEIEAENQARASNEVNAPSNEETKHPNKNPQNQYIKEETGRPGLNEGQGTDTVTQVETAEGTLGTNEEVNNPSNEETKHPNKNPQNQYIKEETGRPGLNEGQGTDTVTQVETAEGTLGTNEEVNAPSNEETKHPNKNPQNQYIKEETGRPGLNEGQGTDTVTQVETAEGTLGLESDSGEVYNQNNDKQTDLHYIQEADGKFIINPDPNQNTDLTVPTEENTDLTVPTEENTDLTIKEKTNTEIIFPPDPNPNPDPNQNPENNENTNVNEKVGPNPDVHTNINYWPWILPATIIPTIIAVATLASTLTLTLKGDAVMDIYQYSTYVDPGCVATDSKDGDLTSKVVVNNPVDTNVIGNYIVTYSVTNSENKTKTAERKVNVIARPTENDFIIKTYNTIPRKYKLPNNARDNILNITTSYLREKGKTKVTSIGMNIIADGVRYTNISSCDASVLNHEPSLVSIYDRQVISEFHDSTCYYMGVAYFPRVGDMTIRDVQDKNEYDSVIAENPVDTFIYESVLVSNGSKATSSQQTSSNIAICATGKNYKVFIPRKNKSLSSYANVLKQNSCVNGVLLPGDAILEYNNKVDSAITKANTTFDSIMYFE